MKYGITLLMLIGSISSPSINATNATLAQSQNYWLGWSQDKLSDLSAYAYNIKNSLSEKIQNEIQQNLKDFEEHKTLYYIVFSSMLLFVTAALAYIYYPRVEESFSIVMKLNGKEHLIPPPINTDHCVTFEAPVVPAPPKFRKGKLKINNSRPQLRQDFGYDPRYDIALPTPVRQKYSAASE